MDSSVAELTAGDPPLPPPAGSLSHIFAGILASPAPPWDPLSRRSRAGAVSPHCVARIKKDLVSVVRDPPPGIHAVPDEADMTVVHALVVGVDDTPYEGGFFYFLVRFPTDYPVAPPQVRLMTTDGGRVRFNPNVYRNGKVCLSILGTWPGPSWSPSLSLSSVLVSVQSLFNEKPYHNEPGYELEERSPGDSDRYNAILRHETLRVAVCGALENETALLVPDALASVMRSRFLGGYERYRAAAAGRLGEDGREMASPFGEKRARAFDHAGILVRMERLRARIGSSCCGDTIPQSVAEGGESSKEEGGTDANPTVTPREYCSSSNAVEGDNCVGDTGGTVYESGNVGVAHDGSGYAESNANESGKPGEEKYESGTAESRRGERGRDESYVNEGGNEEEEKYESGSGESGPGESGSDEREEKESGSRVEEKYESWKAESGSVESGRDERDKESGNEGEIKHESGAGKSRTNNVKDPNQIEEYECGYNEGGEEGETPLGEPERWGVERYECGESGNETGETEGVAGEEAEEEKYYACEGELEELDTGELKMFCQGHRIM